MRLRVCRFLLGYLTLGTLAVERREPCDEQDICELELFNSGISTKIDSDGDLFLLQTDVSSQRKETAMAAEEVDASTRSQAAPWSFYEVSLFPLLLVATVVAYFARPAIESTDDLTPYQFASFEFKKFENRYLLVWGFAVAADWLQGPYVFALYDSFGYSHQDINVLFLAGFVSSMLFGTVVGSLADQWGRRRAALLYCVLYIVSCLTKHCSWYPCLFFGRITGGIATSLLFSTFESWLVSEHKERFRFSDSLLRYMFSMMYFVNYLVAIFSGLFAQAFVAAVPMRRIDGFESLHYGGNLCPFDLAIVMLCIAIPLICTSWPENYGNAETDRTALETLNLAIKTLGSSWQILAVGVIVSCFEAGMYAFVINWTPALEIDGAPAPPLGIVFSSMMVCAMFGASLSSYVRPNIPAANVVLLSCGVACMCFVTVTLCLGIVSLASAVYGCFLIFEICVGLYFPSCSALKSALVPEECRAGIYNLFRVPLNIITCCVVLSSSALSLKVAFGMCATLMATASIALVPITNRSKKSASFDACPSSPH